MKAQSKYINREWRIKISGIDRGNKVHTLIGVARLIEILGEEMTDEIIDKATDRGLDKIAFKFRRGLKVTLYNK